MALESKNEAWNRAPPIFLQFQCIFDQKIMGSLCQQKCPPPLKKRPLAHGHMKSLYGWRLKVRIIRDRLWRGVSDRPSMVKALKLIHRSHPFCLTCIQYVYFDAMYVDPEKEWKLSQFSLFMWLLFSIFII